MELLGRKMTFAARREPPASSGHGGNDRYPLGSTRRRAVAHGIGALVITLMAPQVLDAAVPQASLSTEWGVHQATFETSRGRVTVRLPDDLRAGDTLSGVVTADSAGSSEKRRQANLGRLERHTLHSPGWSAPVADRLLKLTLPADREVLTLELRNARGKTVGRLDVPVGPALPRGRRLPRSVAASGALQLPDLAQEGRSVEVRGPFDGDVTTTGVSLGGQEVPLLAESPRKVVFSALPGHAGLMSLEVRERGLVARGTVRQLRHQLSAGDLDLDRGETSWFRDRISGLEGIDRPVRLDLFNHDREVVRLEGGPHQVVFIAPSEVTPAGEALFERTLTGVAVGNLQISVFTPAFFPAPDVWHVVKEQLDAEALREWADVVVEDLKASMERLQAESGERPPSVVAELIESLDRAIQEVPAAARLGNIDQAKNLVDLYLAPIEVIKTGAALWGLAFDFYQTAIESIASGRIDWELLDSIVAFWIELARGTDNEEFLEKLDQAEKLMEKAREAKDGVDRLKETFEDLGSELAKLQELDGD